MIRTALARGSWNFGSNVAAACFDELGLTYGRSIGARTLFLAEA
jgi:hypothetical protein